MTGREFALLEVVTEPLQSASSLLSPAHVPGSSRTAPPPQLGNMPIASTSPYLFSYLHTYLFTYKARKPAFQIRTMYQGATS